ncbi:MAG: hypothetical protein ACXADO_11505, partial [Candidatus Thorarchaeota archaeon]
TTGEDAVVGFFTETLPNWWDTKAFPEIEKGYGLVVKETEKFYQDQLLPWWDDIAKPAVETFFTKTLPDWWNDVAWKEINRYYFDELLPWWENTGRPAILKVWEEDLPRIFEENVGKPSRSFWEEKLVPWWNENIKDPIVNFFTTGLREWFDENIGTPINTFFTVTLQQELTTFFTETAPRKTGYWLGWAAGKIRTKIGEVAEETKKWFLETYLPGVRRRLLVLVLNFFSLTLFTHMKKETLPNIVDGIVAAVKRQWELMKESWDNFLEGLRKGYDVGRGAAPKSRQECLDAGGSWVTEGGVGRCVMHSGGVVRRDMVATLQKGEVVFNPQRPRPDLARIVNAAMGKVEGTTYGGNTVTVTPTISIGSFGGSQNELNQLQRLLESMSFDMAMKVERKLAEARRVEDRRRQ